jgi:hypothetical protein
VRWPEIRAGLIALAVAIGLVEGCPIPPRAETPEWERGLVEPIRTVQHAVLTPVAWVRPALQITQRWALFQVSEAERYRFEIQGEDTAAGWHLIFRASDPDHDAYEDLIRYRRVLGAFDPIKAPPEAYLQAGQWLGHRILADQPALSAVRLRFERVTLADGEVTGSGIYDFPLVVVRR